MSSFNDSDVRETSLRSSVMRIDMGKYTDDWAIEQFAETFSYSNRDTSHGSRPTH